MPDALLCPNHRAINDNVAIRGIVVPKAIFHGCAGVYLAVVICAEE